MEKSKPIERAGRTRLKDKGLKAKDKPKEERPFEKNPEMTAVLLAAFEENEATKELSPEQKLELVDMSITEQRFQDPLWLQEAVLTIKMRAVTGKTNQEIPVSRPALVTSEDELQAIVNAHHQWIRQTLEPTEPMQAGRANLKGNDLRAFNLDGVDLRSANLEAVNLSGVSLIGANLSGANLSHANLEGAILHRARLRRARLNQANLTRAKAFQTDLRQIQCEGTVWTDAELRDLIHDDTLPKKAKDLMNREPVRVQESENKDSSPENFSEKEDALSSPESAPIG